MSTFTCPVTISSLDGGRAAEVEATVDTGAFYCAMPARLLRGLGIEPEQKCRMRLADGRLVDVELGPAFVGVDGQRVPTLVSFSEDGAPILLGAIALEGLRLLVDSEGQRLIPNEENPLYRADREISLRR